MIKVFVCKYQREPGDFWYRGLRVQVDSTKADKIIDLHGNPVKDVYRIVGQEYEGCFKTEE